MIQLSSTSSARTHAESVVARLPKAAVSDYGSTLENDGNFQSCDQSTLFTMTWKHGERSLHS